MFDLLTELFMGYFDWQHDAALTLAEWIARGIDHVTRPPTPVYLPKSPMTAEEIERVRWRAEQSPTD